MTLRTLACLCLATLTASCGGSDEDEGIALDALCGELATALCNGIDACACGDDSEARCEAAFTARCDAGLLTPDFRRAVTEGRILYSETAAAQLVRDLRMEEALCDSAASSLGSSIDSILGLRGTFTGTTPAGSSCAPLGAPRFDLVSECEEGICNRAGSGAPRCVRLADIGDTCETDATICVQITGPATRWDRWTNDLAGLCEADAICGPRLAEAESCSADVECDSLHCAVPTGATVGACGALQADGEACFAHKECASRYCEGASRPGQCASGDAAVGAACTEAEECATDVCLGGVCSRRACELLSF